MKCQCCGQIIAGVIDPVNIPMSPVRQTIVKTLPATMEQLADAVYGSRSNTPSAQYQSLRVVIRQIRLLLEPHGWTIDNNRSGRGNSKIYRLVRLP